MTGEDVNQATGTATLARLTAATLTAAGHHVTGPDEHGRLLIASRLAHCVLLVTDAPDAEFHWTPIAPMAADPHHAADLAAALLAGPPRPRHPDAKTTSHITFKGIAGMDLRHAGYAVHLNVHADDYYYDVIAELTVTNPRSPGTGTAYITDQGGLTWHRDYDAPHAGDAPEDPATTAQAIAATITHALTTSTAPPARQPARTEGHHPAS